MEENYTTQSNGKTYHLNKKQVKLFNGKDGVIYYFSLDARDTACPLPEGYEVSESSRSKIPVLKKIK